MTTLSSTLTALTIISADNYQRPEESGPRSMTIVRLLNMTAGGILRWALWRGVAFLREMVNVAAASTCSQPTPHTRHKQAPTPYLAHTKSGQISNACAFGDSWKQCNCWQSAVRPRQCLRGEVGYLVGIVGYCLTNAGCLCLYCWIPRLVL